MAASAGYVANVRFGMPALAATGIAVVVAGTSGMLGQRPY